MRFMGVIVAACLLAVVQPTFAADWIEYKNSTDFFSLNSPGQPTVQQIKRTSEYESMFPANVYKWVDGASTFTVTVVDYSDSEALYLANHHSDDFSAAAYWQIDILGSIQYAATQYRMKPGVKVNFDNFHYINLITGHQLQLDNPNGTKTWVAIYLHENRLYVLDATVPRNAPAPIAFQQSFAVDDAQGRAIRYRQYYFNKLPEPKQTRGAGQGTPQNQDPGAPGRGQGAPQR